MRSLVIFAMIALLTACSSSNVKNERVTNDTEFGGGSEEVAPARDYSKNETVETSAPSSSGSSAAKEAPRAAVAANYSALAESVKINNEEGIYREAIKILEHNPSDAKALNAMGVYHYRKGRFLAARYFFNRAAGSAPRSSEVQSNLGVVALALDEQRDAVRLFKKALELNSADGIASANLGAIYVREKDYRRALPLLETAVYKGMREPKTLTNYGIALAGNGKYDQAKKIYEETLKMSGSNEQALFGLSVVLIDHLKQPDEGLTQLNRLKFLGPAEAMRNRMNALENRAKAGHN